MFLPATTIRPDLLGQLHRGDSVYFGLGLARSPDSYTKIPEPRGLIAQDVAFGSYNCGYHAGQP